ncbi:MAG: ethanolamine ammonia-lyase reactivating factor EutA [Lachnospirales bacterium]
MKEKFISVGIDIGTSTTQIIFSNITIENLASDFTVPRVEIIDREIIFKSDIYFTPMISETKINMEEVRNIVDTQYIKAGINKNQIKTGAVVITGETARKENASEVIQYLSGYAGDFVVATAGPDLESIIAGRGAGADLYSKEYSTTIANYDIGGGTSNFSLFKNGELLETNCLDIGGRLIKVDTSKNIITYIAPKIKELIKFLNIDLKVNDNIDIKKINIVVYEMVNLLMMSLNLIEKNQFYKNILTLENSNTVLKTKIENICFSGGVADFIYNNTSSNTFKFGDIGILLGQSIKNHPIFNKINFVEPKETIRATVVGAGSHMAEISGSTIEYTENVLPIKNLPILKLTKKDEKTPLSFGTAINKKLNWFKIGADNENVAISFEGEKGISFQEVMDKANALINNTQIIINNKKPLIVIIEKDMAKVFGQTLKSILGYDYPIVCIDSISVNNGDYVDIGKPIGSSIVLPVVIKTLVFK